MSYSEDTQPNEVRHTHKGNAVIPVIHTSPASGPLSSQRGRGTWHNTNNNASTRGNRYTYNNSSSFMRGRSSGLVAVPHLRNQQGWREGARDKLGGRPFKKQRSDDSPAKDERRGATTHTPPVPFTTEFASVERIGTSPSPPLTLREPSSNASLHPQRSDLPSSPHVALSRTPPPSYSFHEASTSHGVSSSLNGSPHFVNSKRDIMGPRIPNEVLQSPSLQVDVLPDTPRGGLLLHEQDMASRLYRSQLFRTDMSPPSLGSQVEPPRVIAPTALRPSRFRTGKLKFKLPVPRAVVQPLSGRVGDPSHVESEMTISSLDDGAQQYTIIDIPEELPAISEEPTVEAVLMRMDPHDKPRRLFILPHSRTLSITMRGSVDLIEQAPLRCTAILTATPGDRLRPLVDDVCILSPSGKTIIVYGRTGNDQQLSLGRLLDKNILDLGSFDRPTHPDRKGGISVVSPMVQPDMFVTGGYDHMVQTWTLVTNNRPTPSGFLAIRHTSAIQALLAVNDTSHKLLSGSADCSVAIFDLSSERVVNTLKLSNSVYQLHPALSPFCTLVELGHREMQFEVRDHRVTPAMPVIRFGYPNVKVHGRYTRGVVQGNVFACGGSEKDGCVRLWDLRKPSGILRTVSCFPGKKAIGVAFDGSQMVACSEDHQVEFVTHSGDITGDNGGC